MSTGKQPKRQVPAWALLLESLGWLITAVGVIAAAVTVFPFLGSASAEAFAMIVPIAIGTASFGIFLGGVPITIARGADTGKPLPSWKLWARILMRIGGVLSVSIPLAVYGTLPAGLEVARSMRSPGSSSSTISPLDPELLKLTLYSAGVPFILGVILIAASVVWGRRKKIPLSQDADVFT